MMNTMNKYKPIVAADKDDMLRALQELLKIKSITGRTEEIITALNTYLALGRKMGFTAHNYDGLGGTIEFGDGQETIGIIVHMDVVPEGTGWNYPPFAGHIQDGKIYGRGAIDDKGPAISALYALKAVKDAGIEPKNKVQLIIGLDEEGIWNTTPELLKKIKEPDFSFVPDSIFPIVCAEKGLIWLELKVCFQSSILSEEEAKQASSPCENSSDNDTFIHIKQIRGGGESLNIVPDHCEAVLEFSGGQDNDNGIEEKLSSFIQETGYDIQLEHCGTEIKVISFGKSAHAFNCQEGRNAINQLILFLNYITLDRKQKKFIRLYADKLGKDCFGEALGLTCQDDLTGKLTLSPGYIEMDTESVTLKMDIRFPASESVASIQTKIESAFKDFNAEITLYDSLESLHFPEDDPHVRKLLTVYQDHTGDKEARPLGMGGTTFAKAFQRAVAFGPSFPGMAKVEHQPDEYMEIAHLLKCTEIYAQAIEALIL